MVIFIFKLIRAFGFGILFLASRVKPGTKPLVLSVELLCRLLEEASKPLLDLERPGDRETVKACEEQFNATMAFHLSALLPVDSS